MVLQRRRPAAPKPPRRRQLPAMAERASLRCNTGQMRWLPCATARPLLTTWSSHAMTSGKTQPNSGGWGYAECRRAKQPVGLAVTLRDALPDPSGDRHARGHLPARSAQISVWSWGPVGLAHSAERTAEPLYRSPSIGVAEASLGKGSGGIASEPPAVQEGEPTALIIPQARRSIRPTGFRAAGARWPRPCGWRLWEPRSRMGRTM
jgi:hypothetical protein